MANADSVIEPCGMGIDDNAKLFRADGRHLRAIIPGREAFFEQVLRTPAVLQLMGSGALHPVRASTRRIPGHTLVLEQDTLPFVTYPHEWAARMVLDAARLILDINIALMRDGLCLHDAHPWNVVFDGARPTFVDFGSIEALPASKRWPAFAEFRSYCMNALELLECRQFQIYRGLASQVFDGIPDDAASGVVTPAGTSGAALKRGQPLASLSRQAAKTAGAYARAARRKISKQPPGTLKSLEKLRDELADCQVRPPAARWTDYYAGTKNELPVYDGTEDSMRKCMGSTSKHQLIAKVLESRKPGLLMDIGCNRGLYSHHAATTGWRALGIDTDEAAIDAFYGDAKARKLNAATAYVDVAAPRQASSHWHRPMPPAQERLRADTVLCLAVVHHLCFGRPRLRFEDVAHVLDFFTGDCLIVEFVPPEDKHVRTWMTPAFAWYGLDGFLAELRKKFAQVSVHESFPEPRKMIVCSRR